MNDPFDTDVMDEAVENDGFNDGSVARSSFDEAESGDVFEQGFDALDAAIADEFAADEGDTFQATEGDFGEDVSDMAVWSAFEEEVADGLDAADDDEFIGRLLGGLGRSASVISRSAGRVGGLAGQAGRVAHQVGRVAQAASPAAIAAARLARVLGAPGLANELGSAGRVAQGVERASRRAQGLASAVGRTAGGAQSLFGQISQLLSQGNGADYAFDAMVDLYVDEGVDEALPAAVALAARAAARGLGFRNVAQLTQAARRGLVRGVAAATRELVSARGPRAVRALPRLTHSVSHIARRRARTLPEVVHTMREGMPRAARRVVTNPQAMRRLTTAPRPIARPTSMGRGLDPARRYGTRTYDIAGPVTLTITSR
jgi:hypothetical protein